MERSAMYYLVRGLVRGVVYTLMMFFILLGFYGFILMAWSLQF